MKTLTDQDQDSLGRLLRGLQVNASGWFTSQNNLQRQSIFDAVDSSYALIGASLDGGHAVCAIRPPSERQLGCHMSDV
jgi:hypothetical protein